MPSAREGSASKETSCCWAVNGGQLTQLLGTRLLLWSQVIHALFCTLSAILIITREKETKALVLPVLLCSHSQHGPFSLSLCSLEVRRSGTVWVCCSEAPETKRRNRENSTLTFHCSAFFREVSTASCAREPAPAFPSAWTVLASHFA